MEPLLAAAPPRVAAGGAAWGAAPRGHMVVALALSALLACAVVTRTHNGMEPLAAGSKLEGHEGYPSPTVTPVNASADVPADGWNYQVADKEHGPLAWAQRFPGCAGQYQSPINLASAVPGTYPHPAALGMGTKGDVSIVGLEDIGLKVMGHGCRGAAFSSTGSAWEVQMGAACKDVNTCSFEGTPYTLQRMTFKSPSEHTNGGGYYDMELQMWHSSADGKTNLVISVFLLGDVEFNNAPLATLWHCFEDKDFAGTVSVDPYEHLMPGSPEYFTYKGSGTTPPCQPDTQWVIMAQPVHASRQQVASYRSALGSMSRTQDGNNNRPSQPLNNRTAYFFS